METKSSCLQGNDYSVIRLTAGERAGFIMCCGMGLFVLGLLFYRSLFAALACGLASLLLMGKYEKYMAEKRRNRLLDGFRDTLYSLSSSFAAGYQMPTAVRRAAAEMESAYGKDSDIATELNAICCGYEQSHADMTFLLKSFADRSCIPEIEQFSQVYSTCVSRGADIESVCLKTSGLLLDKLSFRRDVQTMISQKKTDIVLLAVMPVAVLLFLNLTAYSYVSVLYETLLGRMVMTCCLLGMAGALFWGLKITDIKV